jgi:hypothetical protein
MSFGNDIASEIARHMFWKLFFICLGVLLIGYTTGYLIRGLKP